MYGYYFKNGRYWFSEGVFDYDEVSSFYKPLTFKGRIAYGVFRFVTKWRIAPKRIAPLEVQQLLNVIAKCGFRGLVVNSGTPGIERSVTGLFSNKESWKFYKISTSVFSAQLLKNEIEFMQLFGALDFVPRVIQSGQLADHFWFISEFLEGEKVSPEIPADALFALLKKLNMLPVPAIKQKEGKPLLQCWSHGDFCSWNILLCGNTLRVVDWEKADIRCIGHDLFTFVIQQKLVLNSYTTLRETLNEYKYAFDNFFSDLAVSSWDLYLEDFLTERISMERKSMNSYLVERYENILAEYYEL